MSDNVYFKFVPTGEVFELTERFLLPEVLWAEKHLDVDMALAGTGSRSVVSMFLLLRRSDPRRWNAQAFAELGTNDFETLDTDDADHPEHQAQAEADEPDPTEGSAPAHERPQATS